MHLEHWLRRRVPVAGRRDPPSRPIHAALRAATRLRHRIPHCRVGDVAATCQAEPIIRPTLTHHCGNQQSWVGQGVRDRCGDVPSLADYLSALDIVGSTKITTPPAVVWVVIVVAVSLITIEVPVALSWLVPEWTTAELEIIGDWLDHHGRTMLIGVLLARSLWLTIESIVGLLSG